MIAAHDNFFYPFTTFFVCKLRPKKIVSVCRKLKTVSPEFSEKVKRLIYALYISLYTKWLCEKNKRRK